MEQGKILIFASKVLNFVFKILEVSVRGTIITVEHQIDAFCGIIKFVLYIIKYMIP